jgi:hypothetical protein
MYASLAAASAFTAADAAVVLDVICESVDECLDPTTA